MTHHESKLQQACIKWFDLQYPQFRLLLFAIPNGGARTALQGAILKGEGVRAGVADLFLAMAYFTIKCGECSPYVNGTFIEMKVGKGKQSESQVEFEREVLKQGYDYVIVRTFEQFQEVVKSVLK